MMPHSIVGIEFEYFLAWLHHLAVPTSATVVMSAEFAPSYLPRPKIVLRSFWRDAGVAIAAATPHSTGRGASAS